MVAGDFFWISTTKIFSIPQGHNRYEGIGRVVTEGVMLLAVDLSIMADNPSGPVAYS